MIAKITRRAALAGVAGAVIARNAGAQNIRLTSVLSEVISTANGGLSATYILPPSGTKPFPTVIVLIDDDGDPVSIEALDRLNKEGYFAVTSNVFSGDPTDTTVMERIDLTREWAIQNRADTTRVGVIGFGTGGRATWLYAAHSPALKAAIAWYGPLQGTISPAHPMTALDAAGHLNAPLLGLYGKNDGTPQRVLLDAEARAKKAGKIAEIVSYVGAGCDFAAPGPSFDQAATLDGWQRTIKWLRDHGVA